jgi:phage shock protein PspC (stress-responsive transcriptional regulator)
MQKVTSINLGGRAYQLEEAAYSALQNYLDEARASLAHDPGKDEIMTDLEQALALKCDQHLSETKDVVTTSEMKAILKAMGPVEPADEDDREPVAVGTAKRLYLIKQGAMIAGVCKGLGAYFNIDVTVIRLLFIVLTFVTSGAWIAVYFILMVVVPEAKTPEQLAEAHGENFNTQELIGKAKQKYAEVGGKAQQWAADSKPALSDFGNVVVKVVRVLAGFAAAILAIVLIWMTVAWVGSLWWLAFGHLHLTDQLSTVSIWGVAAAVSAVFFIASIPLFLIAFAAKRVAAAQTLSKQSTYWVVAGGALWLIAVSVLGVVVAVNAGRFDAYHQNHAYLTINGTHHICIREEVCGNNNPQRIKVLPYPYMIPPKPLPVPAQ